MFSGIIEGIGQVREILRREQGREFILYSNLPTHEMKVGDSISVDGCCLTLTSIDGKNFRVFVSHETLERTTFGQMNMGSRVNLERSIGVGDRLDGHVVQGHVEAVGILKAKEKKGDSLEITIEIPKKLKHLVIPKGSISLDGISLTINWIKDEKENSLMGLNLIPYTLEQTVLGQKENGQGVNLETDLFWQIYI